MPASERKHLDVIRPGKAAASATARPVIVGHGSIIKDPMLQGDQKPHDPDVSDVPERDQERAPVQRSKVVVRPLAEADEQSSDTVAKRDGADATQAQTEQEAEPEVSATSEKTATDTATPEDDVSDQAVVDAVASQASVGKGQKKAQEEQAKQDAIQKLIDDKTYVLPINKAHRARSGRGVGIVVTLLLLLIVGGYLLLDAGIIGGNIKVPFDLIKQSSTASTDSVAPVVQTPKQAAPSAPVTESTMLKTYSSTANGLAFSYPQTWAVNESKDTATGFTNIVATSPSVSLKGANNANEDVQMVLTVAVEGTASAARYPTNWGKLTFCSTESLMLAKQSAQYYAAFVSKDTAKTITAVLLSQKVCDSPTATSASISDQVQFPGKKNTYTVTGQYRYSDAYKKSNPALAQSQPAYSLEVFRGTEVYKQAITILQSLHEL